MAFDQTLIIDVPDKLVPVFEGQARYRGAHGGRGSGKTRTFATMAAVRGAMAAQAGKRGIILCGREYMNSLADSSFSEVKEAIESNVWLSSMYEVGKEYIRTRDGRVEFSFAGLRHNIGSVKSKALIILCWVDEAERVSEQAWMTLMPTVRESGSEIWVTWNPERKGSATDLRFRNPKDDDMRIVQVNWQDNPWFPDVLNKDRVRDLRDRPDQYAHIWDGEYATAAIGAYYAAGLLEAKNDKRIGKVAKDPLLTIRSYHDIGGSGRTADNYSIWVCQFVAKEIRILDHYTAQGQPIDAHAHWMRSRGWERAQIILPHDGVQEDARAKSWEDHWRDAGFKDTRTIPNQGPGAAMMRVTNARRLFPRMWFNEDTTQEGRISLGMYAPKISKETGADLGPNHDVYSHDADSFGLMASDYEEPRAFAAAPQRPRFGTMA